MADTLTATGPNGVVHILDDNRMTLCGQDAISWSTFVTEAQRIGLVLFCPVCEDDDDA